MTVAATPTTSSTEIDSDNAETTKLSRGDDEDNVKSPPPTTIDIATSDASSLLLDRLRHNAKLYPKTRRAKHVVTTQHDKGRQ